MSNLGDFELLEEIGRGGMGVVYRAHQVSLARDVAVKVLPPDMARDAQVAERFAAEARKMAMLSHPNIAQVYAVGEEGGQRYIAMQYVPGGTLEDRLRRGPLDLNWAAETVAQVAEALDHAHQQGLIHRDIKPGNILFDAQGNAVVTDFGIAKAGDEVRKTRTGLAVGTPQYMAPEQARGNPVDARADIYALGVVLYEMVCGRPPFEGDTPVSVAMKHLTDVPLPPRALCANAEPWLESIILKAMAKEPAERFRTAGEMAAALRSHAFVGYYQPTQTPFPAVGADPRGATQVIVSQPPRPKNNPVMIALAIALGLVGIGAIALAVRPRTDPPRPANAVTNVAGSNVGGANATANLVDKPHTTVPSVVGLTEAKARETLTATGGFKVMMNDRVPSTSVPAGCVVRQQPAGGASVEPGDVVYLVASMGPPPPPNDGEIIAAINKWEQDWESLNASRYVLGNYAPDAKIHSNDQWYDRDSFYQHEQQIMNAAPYRISIDCGTPTISPDPSDMTRVKAVFPMVYNRIGGTGGGYTSRGGQTLVFERNGGSWSIVLDDFSKG